MSSCSCNIAHVPSSGRTEGPENIENGILKKQGNHTRYEYTRIGFIESVSSTCVGLDHNKRAPYWMTSSSSFRKAYF